MAVRVADSLKQQNDLKTFPVAYSEDIWIDKNKGEGEKDYADLQELYNEGALGGSGLPTPESKDKLLVSTENEETSELEWSQIDKGTIDGSAYVNLDVGSDLNTLVTHGRYRTTTKRIDRIENLPVQVAGMLTVRLTGSVIYQTYNSIDNKMYTRTSEDAGENWSDWKDVSEGGDEPFKGTHDEWDALTDSEKAQYKTVIFTDDYDKPNMKFPDYAHPFTISSSPWTAPCDCWVTFQRVSRGIPDKNPLLVNGYAVACADYDGSVENGIKVISFYGLIKEGDVLTGSAITDKVSCGIYPLV